MDKLETPNKFNRIQITEKDGGCTTTCQERITEEIPRNACDQLRNNKRVKKAEIKEPLRHHYRIKRVRSKENCLVNTKNIQKYNSTLLQD